MRGFLESPRHSTCRVCVCVCVCGRVGGCGWACGWVWVGVWVGVGGRVGEWVCPQNARNLFLSSSQLTGTKTPVFDILRLILAGINAASEREGEKGLRRLLPSSIRRLLSSLCQTKEAMIAPNGNHFLPVCSLVSVFQCVWQSLLLPASYGEPLPPSLPPPLL